MQLLIAREESVEVGPQQTTTTMEGEAGEDDNEDGDQDGG